MEKKKKKAIIMFYQAHLLVMQYSKREGSTNHLSNVLSGHCLSSERTQQELYVASSSSVLQSSCA